MEEFMSETDLLLEARYALESGKLQEAYELLDQCYSDGADLAMDELERGNEDSAAIAIGIIEQTVDELGS